MKTTTYLIATTLLLVHDGQSYYVGVNTIGYTPLDTKLHRRAICEAPEVARDKNIFDTSKNWPFESSRDDVSAIRQALAKCHIDGNTIVPDEWPVYSNYCFDRTSTWVASKDGLERIPKDDPLARYYFKYLPPPINYQEVYEDVQHHYFDYYYDCLREWSVLSEAGPKLIDDATARWNEQQESIKVYDGKKQAAANDGICFPIEQYPVAEYLGNTGGDRQKLNYLLYHLLNCALLDQKIVPEEWTSTIIDCFSELREISAWKDDVKLEKENTIVELGEEFRTCLDDKRNLEWMNTAQSNIKYVKSLQDVGGSVRFKSP